MHKKLSIRNLDNTIVEIAIYETDFTHVVFLNDCSTNYTWIKNSAILRLCCKYGEK